MLENNVGTEQEKKTLARNKQQTRMKIEFQRVCEQQQRRPRQDNGARVGSGRTFQAR